MDPVDTQAKSRLDQLLDGIGEALDADVVAVIGPIMPGIDAILRDAMEALDEKRNSIVVILDTSGGVVEVVETMVNALRHEYGDVTMIIPNKAMSAGTIFALSADRIMMDHLSCLGPIDPQVVRGDKLVPALAYLIQYERLIDKSVSGDLTVAEFGILKDFDLGELFLFERARELSIDLVQKWLSTYKFKNWERNGNPVDQAAKEARAKEIAEKLNNAEIWHSHARPINREILRAEVGLQIDNLEENKVLFDLVREYFLLLVSYMDKNEWDTVVQSKEYFQ